MKPIDVQNRINAGKVSNCKDIKPGPHQHGFAEYVSMLEGPGSHRLSTMIPKSTLYHEGSKHLVRNDVEYRRSDDILTNRQTDEAIRVMSESTAAG